MSKTEKETPSGPGAEVLFEALRTFLMSLGLMGLRSKGWNDSSWGLTRFGGYHIYAKKVKLQVYDRNRSVQCTMYLTLHTFSLKLCSATIDLKT